MEWLCHRLCVESCVDRLLDVWRLGGAWGEIWDTCLCVKLNVETTPSSQ